MTVRLRCLLLFYGISLVKCSIGESGQIGKPCLVNSPLACSLPNSQCIEGICMCANFYRYANGSCITDESTTLGRPCRGGADCRGQGEFCSSFAVCMCLSTHVDLGNQCKPVIYPGQFGCEDTRQCSKGFPGAECDVSRTCVCPHGMHVHQQTCIMSSVLGNAILSDDRHQLPFFERDKTPSKNFFQRRLAAPKISDGVSPDDVCSVDSDCAGYPLSFCDGVCKCVHGALNAGSTCISTGSALQPAGSCPPGQTYITEAGACMTTQHPGEPCQYSQQCAAAEPGAYCLRLRCECVYGMRQSGSGCTFANSECTQRGFIWISELGECREVIPPGLRGCSHNLQCTGAYPEATCYMQTCTCPPNLPVAIDGTCGRNCTSGETYSGVTGQCLPTVQPGGQCIYSSQCHAIYPGMICDKNICRCPNGLKFSGNKCSQGCPSGLRLNSKGVCVEACRPTYVEFEGECLPQSVAGGTCTVNAQCTGGSSCHNGVCQCPMGMTPKGSECAPMESAPLGSCRNGEKCGGGSYCSNGNCTCPVGRQVVNGQCVSPQSVPIGGACVRIGVKCGGGSICVAGVCVCPLGKTPRNEICVNHATVNPGEDCSQGQECTGNSHCNDVSMTCECSSSQMVIGRRCVERLRAHPGYTCANGEICIGNSICVNGKCACDKDRIEINKVCQERVPARVGETCRNGEMCTGGSTCDTLLKRCTCGRGKQNIGGECIEVQMVSPGERCTASVTRCGGGSYCARGRCECPLNMRPQQRKCVQQKQVFPGQDCSDGDLCTGASVCKDGICRCTADMVLRGTVCVHKRKVEAGSSCEPLDECMGNSTCVESRCRCEFGQIIRNGVCSSRKTVLPGYLCNLDDVCIAQSVCVKGVCQCKPYFTRIHNQCVKNRMVMAGGVCLRTDDCEGESECRQGICRCPAGKIAINGVCKSAPTVTAGESCALGEICSGGSVCGKTTKVCECEKDLEFVNGKCVRRTPPESLSQTTASSTSIRSETPTSIYTTQSAPTMSQRCFRNSDCGYGAMCRKNVCVCPVGMQMRNNVCYSTNASIRKRPGLLGHECHRDDDCKVAHSECQLEMCMCKSGFRIFGSTQCIRKLDVPVEPTAPTVVIEEETPVPEVVVPIVRPITADPPTTTSPRIPTILLVLPGSVCDENRICQRGSQCVDKLCVCPIGATLVKGVCTPVISQKIVPPLSSCARGEICSGNSECLYGLCFCTTDFTLFRGRCERLEKIDGIRAIEAEMVTLTPRRAKTTPSTPELVQTSTTQTTVSVKASSISTMAPFWFKIAKPGFACDDSTFCTNCSICVGGFCLCPEGLELLRDKCVSPIDARRCIASNQCPSGADCVKGECQCQQGLALSRFGFCIPINYAEPGTSCAEGEQCRGESLCVEGMCICKPQLFLKDNRCVPSLREVHSESQVIRSDDVLSACPLDKSCQLPNCFCSENGISIPGGLDKKSTPQMIVLTFDDPVTDRVINIYKSLFSGKIRNQNGCAIKATFFLSHQWNNYDQSQWLHSRGNEIAVNSITNEMLANKTKERWRHEMAGMRDSLHEFSYVEKSSVKGTRAPYFVIGGDAQFEMMAQNGFAYDNSMPVKEGPYWPQTLDHKLAWDCGQQLCPQKPYKGLWEVPIQLLQANDGIWYNTAAKALKPYDTRQSVKQMLSRNFMRNYKTTRAPFIISLDTDFLTYLPDNGAVIALEDWLTEMVNKTDVYVVTAAQMLSWMKSPVDVNAAAQFRPWQCNFLMNDHIHPCETPSVCSYSSRTASQLAHSFRVCGSCPKNYPWIEDPLGRRQLA